MLLLVLIPHSANRIPISSD